MDVHMAALAERLDEEYAQVSSTTVIRVLTDCVADFPDQDAHFVHEAARAQLNDIAGRTQEARGS